MEDLTFTIYVQEAGSLVSTFANCEKFNITYLIGLQTVSFSFYRQRISTEESDKIMNDFIGKLENEVIVRNAEFSRDEYTKNIRFPKRTDEEIINKINNFFNIKMFMP